MKSPHINENRFIPACIFTNAIAAAVTPYISFMIRSLGYSTVMVGILLGIFEGAGIAGPIVLGFLADKTGKFRLLLIAVCLAPALIAFPLALLVHPLVSALLLGLMAFCFKAISSLLDAATTIQIGSTGNYGRIRVWGSVGFVLAVMYLQWTPVYRLVNAVNIAFWIAVISLISIASLFLLPGTTRKTEILPDNSAEIPRSNKKIISFYFVIGFMLIFVSRFSMAAFFTFFPLYLTEVIKWDAIGLMYALSSASEIPFILFSDKIIRRFGALPLLAFSTIAVCVRLLILAAFTAKPVLAGAQLLHSLCYGVFHPAAINFISRVFPPEKRGLGMSIYLALGTGLPILIGNMAGGIIVDAVGYRSLMVIYAAVSGLAVIVYCLLRKKAAEV